MRKLEKNTRRYFVNLFADYILSKFKKSENTIIQVTDCENFVIVNGQTTSTNVLDLSIVKKEFCDTFTDLLKSLNMEDINILDIIKYDQVIDDLPKAWVSVNKSLYVEETESFTDISITSEFPYGYSLRTGRSMVYYSHYILNQISSTIGSDNMFIHFLPKVEDEMDIKVITNSMYDSKTIKSLILDVFDFDLEDFSNRMESYDLTHDILDPEGLKPYLVQDRLEDVIIF
jgi:hypothetical protein